MMTPTINLAKVALYGVLGHVACVTTALVITETVTWLGSVFGG